MKPKLILFDFDGTLADSRQLFFDLYNELALQRGYVLLTEANTSELRNLSITERCKKLGIPLYRIPFIASAIIKQYKGNINRISLYPGIRDMFAELDALDIPYAVLSSNSKENIAAFFEQRGLTVPEIYTSSRIFGKDKAILKVLRAKKLSASQVLYVGDELRDLEACLREGVKMAWVHWGYDSREALGDLVPDFEPEHPVDIARLAH